MFSTKALAWLALAATVCFLALIAVQVLEWLSFSAGPSVWLAAR